VINVMVDWLQNNVNWEMYAAFFAVVAFIYALVKWGLKGIKYIAIRLWRVITRYRPNVPRETVRIIPTQTCQWSKASLHDEKGIHVIGRFYVTNIINEPVRLLATKLIKTSTEGMVLVKHPTQNFVGAYDVLPNTTSEVITDFTVIPFTKEDTNDLLSDVLLTDQYANQHRVKKVRFRGPSLPVAKKNEPRKEAIYGISDPLEKQIVSILKDEVIRYAECGRRVGGLGSVHTIINGADYPGVGTDTKIQGSPVVQSIHPNPSTVSITSDNATALYSIYQKLDSDVERDGYVAILLSRLSKDSEYAPIGYLIMYTLFQIGYLPQALEKAKEDLQRDSEYGFSDLLRLLDGLLKFKHPEFDDTLLDKIEKFIQGIDEHTFRIQERLVAIRADRFRKR
jgi:hypothetical protein